MSEFLCFTSQLYLSESDTLESYIDEALINPNKDELSQIIAFLTLIILAIILVKLYLNGNNNFWPDRGVMLVRTSDTSSILDILRGHTSYTRDFDISIYKKLQDKKFAGLMEVQRPVFFVKDIDLAKRILCEDYDHFVTQQKFMLEKTNPLIMEMFIMLTRMKWGEMRTTPVHPPTMLEAPAPTTQTSTTTRLVEEHLRSQLFSHFNSSGAQLVEFVRRESEKVENHTDGISVTECFGRFTMDVIAKACFGVENSCLNEKESGLYKYREMFQLLGPWRMAKVFISFLFPRVAALFRISFIEQESTKFFKNIVEHTINHRKNNEKAYNTASAAAAGKKNGSLRLRQDFLQLLLDTRDKQMKIDEASELEHSLMTRPTPTLPPSSPPLKIAESEKYSDYPKSTRDSTANALTRSTGALLTDDNDGRSNAGNKLYLTDELILAQSICSFLAEYDTMASHLLSFATYALAVNPECQEKLYTEIVQCLRREKSGALDYNSVNSIEYMDMFINGKINLPLLLCIRQLGNSLCIHWLPIPPTIFPLYLFLRL